MKRLSQVCFTALVLALITPQTAPAQVPDREMARCAAISEPTQRLACLDALAFDAVSRLQPTAQAELQSRAKSASFGVAAKPAALVADLIESEIEGWVDGWGERTRFQLKNGQIWRVSDDSSGDVNLRDPKVTVRRNVLGTYFLEFAGRNSSPKVRRVQ
jgi:hypothetical protein